MKLTKQQSLSPIIEPMLPLINVVFLLLIFFMIAGHISPPIEAIALPEQQHKNPLNKQQRSQKDWLTVSVTGELSYQQQLIELSTLALLFSNKKQLSLLVDKSITTGKLKQITEALTSIGVKKVSLITQLSVEGNNE